MFKMMEIMMFVVFTYWFMNKGTLILDLVFDKIIKFIG